MIICTVWMYTITEVTFNFCFCFFTLPNSACRAWFASLKLLLWQLYPLFISQPNPSVSLFSHLSVLHFLCIYSFVFCSCRRLIFSAATSATHLIFVTNMRADNNSMTNVQHYKGRCFGEVERNVFVHFQWSGMKEVLLYDKYVGDT